MEKKDQQYLIISKETLITSEEGVQVSRDLLAKIPARTGIYETPQGEVEIAVFKPNKKDNTRKVIFSGEGIAPEGKRRVVIFPSSLKKEVKHPVGPTEFLVFSQAQVKKREER